MVDSKDVVSAIETVFSRCRAVQVGRIRTELVDLNKNYESIDLDFALQHCVNAWEELWYQRESRLDALFAMADGCSCGNFSALQFHAVPDPRLPCLLQRASMPMSHRLTTRM